MLRLQNPRPKKGLKYHEQQELEGIEERILEAETQVQEYEDKLAELYKS